MYQRDVASQNRWKLSLPLAPCKDRLADDTGELAVLTIRKIACKVRKITASVVGTRGWARGPTPHACALASIIHLRVGQLSTGKKLMPQPCYGPPFRGCTQFSGYAPHQHSQEGIVFANLRCRVGLCAHRPAGSFLAEQGAMVNGRQRSLTLQELKRRGDEAIAAAQCPTGQARITGAASDIAPAA